MILGRSHLSTFETACRREWLVSNGLGSYACGTVGGANTRRYHGFLIASRTPPVGRTLLVAKVEVSLEYLGQLYHLGGNEFAGGAVDPRGFIHIESFSLEHGIPRWRYALADALIEQCIFMAPDAQTSYLTLEVKRAAAPVRCELKPLLTHRDHHAQSRGRQPLEMQLSGAHLTVRAATEPACHLMVEGARIAPLDEWYWNFLHREEYARGLDALEDLYAPGRFEVPLGAGRPVVLTASTEPTPPPAAAEVRRTLEARSIKRRAALPPAAPEWVAVLATATDTFIAHRAGAGAGAAPGEVASGAPATVIAGFPWFADWGRDTMIALPGLATVLGRHDVTRSALRTYAGYLDRGMLPNRFPDEGAPPEYNTADATLWFFRALDAHLEAERDPDLARELEPKLMSILRAHHEGTRYGIHVDPADGLLHAGEPGTQVTWMDAKQGDHVFTPRIGKPVEINALWLNALDVTRRLTRSLRHAAEERLCAEWLERASTGFQRFWNAGSNALYDVLDAADGAEADARIRPNQIFAVALPYSPLAREAQRAVVESCARELLTSYGLRSLSPSDPGYRGQYRGNAWERDAAYHQGTAWSWLLGPFALAHYRVYGDAAAAQSFLEPIAEHLSDACVGQVSEIFEGDAPHEPRGCFAQAWGVAEILRAWVVLERAKSQSPPGARKAAAGPAAPGPAVPGPAKAPTAKARARTPRAPKS